MPYKPRNLTEEIENLAEERVKNPKPLDQNALELRDMIADCDDLSVVAESANELLSIDQAAELLGVSLQTLRNWDKQGKLTPASRTAGNHRRYLRS